MSRARGERGQASVELVTLLPLVVLLLAAVWQATLAGQALWLSGSAARAAARAAAVGADAETAARRVLPARLDRRVEAKRRHGGVELELGIPLAVGGGTLASFTVRARLPEQGA